MAQKPPKGPAARAVTNEALQAKVDIDLSDIYTRLQNRATELLTDAQQRGLDGEALADYVVGGVRDLSTAPIERAGRSATSEAYNLGRNLAAQQNEAAIGRVVRTEILDDATCDPCIELDGFTTEINSPAYFVNMPPNHCEGREMCRGFYMYEAA
jgi:hypothetical protein